MAVENPSRDVAVLVSGGIDSAILCIDLLADHARVHPIYVRFGLRWEEVELRHLHRFLDEVARPGLEPLKLLDEPIATVYGDHWSLAGPTVPDAGGDDRDVYLPGRNLLLVGKAAVWCSLQGIDALALGTLRGNPFADSRPEFLRGFEGLLKQALGRRLRLLQPYARLPKEEVLARGAGLPLEHTFSCLAPIGGGHCGECNKCGERREVFRKSGGADPTRYANEQLTPS